MYGGAVFEINMDRFRALPDEHRRQLIESLQRLVDELEDSTVRLELQMICEQLEGEPPR
jgi:hypothetical protein